MFKKNTLSVDAAYSSKTGIMEYRGVWTDSGNVYFHETFSVGTNNVGEFLAVVHALAKMKSEGIEKNTFSSSKSLEDARGAITGTLALAALTATSFKEFNCYYFWCICNC